MNNLDSSSRTVANRRRELHRRLPAEIGSAREARRELNALARHLAKSELQIAELLTSELVSNSVKHSGTGAVELDVAVDPRVLRVEVRDGGPGFEPPRQDAGDDMHWGLQLVDELSDRWGVQPQKGDTRVWFELDRAAA